MIIAMWQFHRTKYYLIFYIIGEIKMKTMFSSSPQAPKGKEATDLKEEINNFTSSDEFLALATDISAFQIQLMEKNKSEAVARLAILFVKHFQLLHQTIANYIKRVKSGELVSFIEFEIIKEKYGIIYNALVTRAQESQPSLNFFNLIELFYSANKLHKILEKSNSLLKYNAPLSANLLPLIHDNEELKNQITQFFDSLSFKSAKETSLQIIGTRLSLFNSTPPITETFARTTKDLFNNMEKVFNAESDESISLFELKRDLGKFEASYEAFEQDTKKDWSEARRKIVDCAKELIDTVEKYSPTFQRNASVSSHVSIECK